MTSKMAFTKAINYAVISKLWLLLKLSFAVLILVHGSSMAAAQALAKPHCQERCGEMLIPYPFGIGDGCYKGAWFEIVCRKTSNSSTPFLKKLQKEVLNITLGFQAKGDIRIETNLIASSGCPDRSGPGTHLAELMNITLSPFFISNKNLFTAVGCNIRASLSHIDPVVTGCDSTCDARTYGTKELENFQPCSGYRCCQVRLGLLIPVIGARFERLDIGNGTARGGCEVAFLTDKIFYTLNASEPELLLKEEYMAPMLLDWFVDYDPSPDSKSISCQKDVQFDGFPITIQKDVQLDNFPNTTYYCWCRSGFRGNPYLPGGCEDIDECQDGGTSICGANTCVNTIGSYNCEVKRVWPLVLGICVGSGLLFLVAGTGGFYKAIKKWERRKLIRKHFKRNGGLLLQQQLSSADGTIEKSKIFSFKELEKATDRFSQNRILGQGGQGTVYKGMLIDGSIVAVKKSKLVDVDKIEEFINEIVILSQVNHRNIVRLFGCCLETEVPTLVYEFVPNNNLFHHLCAQSDEFLMTWEVRLRIATEIAGALCYLHSAAPIPIYHRDIKSTNILLDEKYRVKVSDFGISRSVSVDQTHLTTKVQGTFGYFDPEYFRSSQFTDKSDVYSFGVVLVELLTGEKPASVLGSEETKHLASDFLLAMKENTLFDILDARIVDQCKLEEVTQAANLARRCLNRKGKRRPTMKEVAMELERIQSPHKNSNFQIYNDERISEAVEIDVRDWAGGCTASAPYAGSPSVSDLQVPLFLNTTWSL